MNPYYDLALVYADSNRIKEAISVLEEGMKISENFKEKGMSFYTQLKGKVDFTFNSNV